MYKNVNQSNAYQELIPVSGVSHRSLTVSSSALALVTPLNDKTRYVLLSVNTAEGIRVTFDGAAPTATDGHFLAAGSERLLSREMAIALKMIRVTNDVNVTITELSR